MADIARTQSTVALPTQQPDVTTPDDYQRINATPEKFGMAVARGQEERGQGEAQFARGASSALAFYNEAAADSASNDYQDQVNKILHGDSSKMVPGPDGQLIPDKGYLGLKGQAAMRARPGVEKQIEELQAKIGGTLKAPAAQVHFDSFSRRYRAVTSSQIGTHADTQSNAWYSEVAKDEVRVNTNDLTANADDPERVRHAASGIINGYVKLAQLQGAVPGDPVWQAAIQKGTSAAMRAQILAVGVKDPQRAGRMADNYKAELGADYAVLADHFRPRAEQQNGRDVADGLLGGTKPAGVSGDMQGVQHDAETKLKAQGITLQPTSTTRSHEENEKAGGARDSQHLHGNASDYSLAGRSDEEKKKIIDTLLSDPRVGGFGYYPANESIHVDVRPGRMAWGQDRTTATVGQNWPDWMKDRVAAWKGHTQEVVPPTAAAAQPTQTADGPQPKRPMVELVKEVLDMHLPAQAEAAAISRIHQSYSLSQDTEARARTAFDATVKDSTTEAMNTGTTLNPVGQAEFVRHYGTEDGPRRYQSYIDDVKFGADWKALQTMSDSDQQNLVNAREPDPRAGDYARNFTNQQRLQKAVDAIQKQRAEDPAGSVARDGGVIAALQQYKPNQPGSFQPVVEARLAAQGRLGIPEPVQSAISEAEAKHYAASLKPVAKEGVDPKNQEQVINSVVSDVAAKYGDHATEALNRVLYHVTLKHDAAGVLAEALSRLSQGKEPQTTPADARKVQIERDAERAALLSGRAAEVARSTVGLEPGQLPATPGPAEVGRAVNQANQKIEKPFSEAVEMLRADPAKLMPFFVQKFGIAKVPPDLAQYLPKPKAEAAPSAP